LRSADERGVVKLLAGCAPCQPFSTYHWKSDCSDDRWNLLDHFGRLARELNPDLITMENVPNEMRVGVIEAGTMVRPPASMILVVGPRIDSSSRRVPIPITLSPLIAIACARGVLASRVTIFAFYIIISALVSCAIVATGSNTLAAA
jgi:hypothetical protein